METKQRQWATKAISLLLTSVVALSAVWVATAAPQRRAAQQQKHGVMKTDSRTGRTTLELTGNCVKIGVKDTGSLGIGGDTTPGIEYDDTCTGTFNPSYDFLTPGTPWEQLSIKLTSGGTTTNYQENNDSPHEFSTNPTLTDKSGIAYRGKTYAHRAVQTSENAAFSIENDIHFDANSKYVEIDTYVTPKTAVTDLYILRAIDSDAVVSGSDTSDTNNARGYSTLKANNLVFSETTSSKYVMGYYTGQETNTNTGISGEWSSDPSDYWGGVDDGNGDNTIGIVAKFASVASGATVSFKHAYIFGPSAFAASAMAVSRGLGGGIAGKTPRCTGTASVCAPKDVGSAVMTNTAAPVTDTPTPTLAETYTPSITKPPTATMTPTPIPFMMKKGAVGANFVLALLANGTLVTWGMNKEYQANIPPCCGSKIDDIAVGTNFAVALKGGKVYGWGANTLGQLKIPLAAGKDVTALAAGFAHVLALKSNGSVIAWGENKDGQATVPKTAINVVQMAGGSYHSLVVKADGKVIGWGRNTNGQAKAPADLANVYMVAAGLDHSLALKKDGTVVAWGNSDKGQSKVPPTLKDVKFVSAGNKFSLALKNDGTPFGWGQNNEGQITMPTGYTGIFTVAAGYANSIIGLRNGGILVAGNTKEGMDASRTPTNTATPTR